MKQPVEPPHDRHPVPPAHDNAGQVLLQVDRLTRRYTMARERLWRKPGQVDALQSVSFTLHGGRSLGIVGESGSGKSTLARLVMALEQPSSGSVRIAGTDLASLDPVALRSARRNFQMVFQDPYGSLDPRQTVQRIVSEPLQAQGVAGTMHRAMAHEAMVSVGLRPGDLEKYPHEFSGGQRQRIAIARALITRPRLIVADEPVSALDISVQAQVLNLMQQLQQRFDVTYLLISHDLAVVAHLCAEVAVMFQGRIVEQGDPLTLFRDAAHPYTRALVAALPRLEPRTTAVPASPSVVMHKPQLPYACPYAHRCPGAQPLCEVSRPELLPLAAGHQVACHFPQNGQTAT